MTPDCFISITLDFFVFTDLCHRQFFLFADFDNSYLGIRNENFVRFGQVC